MNRNLTLTLALAAGLLGGMVSRKISLPAVHAQSPAPSVVRAQSFVLVDSHGAVIGTFTSREPTVPATDKISIPPRIVLLDHAGREIWGSGDVRMQPAGLR